MDDIARNKFSVSDTTPNDRKAAVKSTPLNELVHLSTVMYPINCGSRALKSLSQFDSVMSRLSSRQTVERSANEILPSLSWSKAL